jgi:hypothetical protein
MFFPKSLYGTRAQSIVAGRKTAKKLLSGSSWSEAISDKAFVEFLPEKHELKIELVGFDFSFSDSIRSRSFMEGLSRQYYKAWDDGSVEEKASIEASQEQLFQNFLAEAWSTLLILSGGLFERPMSRKPNQIRYHYSRFLPMLQAVARFWGEYEKLGEAFYVQDAANDEQRVETLSNGERMTVIYNKGFGTFTQTFRYLSISGIPYELQRVGFPVSKLELSRNLPDFLADIENLRPFLEDPRVAELERTGFSPRSKHQFKLGLNPPRPKQSD